MHSLRDYLKIVYFSIIKIYKMIKSNYLIKLLKLNLISEN